MSTATLKQRLGPLAALRRYFGIIISLLRREEELRRHAPGEAILNLLEPLMLILMITGARYMMERYSLPPIGDSIMLFYATGFFAKYFFIYVSRRMRGIARVSGRRFPVEQRLDHIIVHVIMRSIDYAILGVLLFGGIYLLLTPTAYPYDFVPAVEAALALIGL
jgi:hypothetical protein